jgi:hypothetical protein
LYADGDPVNNIDPDGHLPKWLQRGWKATKKWAKKGYNFAIGDDIRTLKSPKSKWYHKAGAAASIASNFIPGAGAVKWGVKAVKYGKKMKKSRKFAAASIKKMRKAKLKTKAKVSRSYHKAKKVAHRTKSYVKSRIAKPKRTGKQLRLNLQFFAGGKGKVQKYEVGIFDDLQKRSVKGDGLDIHHVAQKHPASQVIPGYDSQFAPSIAVPAREHKRIPTIKGNFTGSARDLLAKDIWDLRRHTKAPNSALRELINLNKSMYPEAFRKR